MSVKMNKTGPRHNSPKTGSRVAITSQDHVQVRTSLQVTQSCRDVREVVEDAGCRSWGIIKEDLTDKAASCEAVVRDDCCSLRVLGICREVGGSSPDLIELRRRVYNFPTLTKGQMCVGKLL